MSLVIQKLASLVVFVAWFVIGTLVLRAVENVLGRAKDKIAIARTAKS